MTWPPEPIETYVATIPTTPVPRSVASFRGGGGPFRPTPPRFLELQPHDRPAASGRECPLSRLSPQSFAQMPKLPNGGLRSRSKLRLHMTFDTRGLEAEAMSTPAREDGGT
jgi:hypothetical protein